MYSSSLLMLATPLSCIRDGFVVPQARAIVETTVVVSAEEPHEGTLRATASGLDPDEMASFTYRTYILALPRQGVTMTVVSDDEPLADGLTDVGGEIVLDICRSGSFPCEHRSLLQVETASASDTEIWLQLELSAKKTRARRGWDGPLPTVELTLE